MSARSSNPSRTGATPGFENRFRGSEEDIRRQQAGYIASPSPRAGRSSTSAAAGGSSWTSSASTASRARASTSTAQMIDVCVDKGSNCRKGRTSSSGSPRPPTAPSPGSSPRRSSSTCPPPTSGSSSRPASPSSPRAGVDRPRDRQPDLGLRPGPDLFSRHVPRKAPPPLALKFLLECSGFRRSKCDIRRRSGRSGCGNSRGPTSGRRPAERGTSTSSTPSSIAPPNYAVIGKKAMNDSLHAGFDLGGTQLKFGLIDAAGKPRFQGQDARAPAPSRT